MKLSKETMQSIKLYQAQDFEIDSESTEYVIMKKNTSTIFLHVVILCLTWWTLGLANLAYHFMSVKKKKIMK